MRLTCDTDIPSTEHGPEQLCSTRKRLILLFLEHVHGTSSVPDPVLDAGDPVVNKTKIPIFVELAFQGERQTASEKRVEEC